MKKLLITLALVSGLYGADAASFSLTLPANSYSNAVPLIGGSIKVQQFILTSATGAATVQMFDAPTNQLAYTNAPYTNIFSYATNLPYLWTNYFGVTNTFTNLVLVDVTNSVPGTTNSYPIRVTIAVPTNNTSLRIDQVQYQFNSGLWISNQGPSAATVSGTYTQ